MCHFFGAIRMGLRRACVCGFGIWKLEDNDGDGNIGVHYKIR
jgi:hypothetical protein